MPNNDLISRSALLVAYDAAHKGPPGGARKLMEEAPAIDAVPVALLDKYENEPMLKTPIHLIKNIWQHERDKHIEGGKDNAEQWFDFAGGGKKNSVSYGLRSNYKDCGRTQD